MVLRYWSGLILSGGLWVRVLSVQYCTATTGGRSLFEAVSDTLACFEDEHYKGLWPTEDPVLEVTLVGW